MVLTLTSPRMSLQPQVAADFFIHVPLVYLPLYYAFEETVVFNGTQVMQEQHH